MKNVHTICLSVVILSYFKCEINLIFFFFNSSIVNQKVLVLWKKIDEKTIIGNINKSRRKLAVIKYFQFCSV